MPWLFAHQGGWDEILMFSIPIVVAVVAVKWAQRRGAKKSSGSDVDTTG